MRAAVATASLPAIAPGLRYGRETGDQPEDAIRVSNPDPGSLREYPD